MNNLKVDGEFTTERTHSVVNSSTKTTPFESMEYSRLFFNQKNYICEFTTEGVAIVN